MRRLNREQLPQLCSEVRSCLIDTVSKTAGHLASGLGVVELTVALHYVYNTPHDVLVWDVGHQAYPHKILTGHRKEFATIRQHGGLHAFIWRGETPYDLISTGHASTSIGSALGIAITERNKPQSTRRRVVAIIGDGALSGGCAFEALNHAGSFKDIDLTVILNDNEMSISENVGSLAQGLSHVLSSPHYVKLVEGGKRILDSLPAVRDLALRAQEHVKGMIMPGTLFEEFGFNYIGPVDGNDVGRLVSILHNIREIPGLKFLHVVTKKGKGYAPAEKDPVCYHGVPAFNPEKGIRQIETSEDLSYSAAFGRWMCDRAVSDRKLMGITPAMRIGSGMDEFARKYPHQFFDVAIAEQHAMVLASGLAAGGMRPVVNIYSTFMQRAYDGLIHDMAVQNLPIILCLDRGGVVGPDGPTHNGAFDIAYTRTVPNLVIMVPGSRHELYYMLNTAYQLNAPTVIRYPRSQGESLNTSESGANRIGRLSLEYSLKLGSAGALHLSRAFAHTLKTAAAGSAAPASAQIASPAEAAVAADSAAAWDQLLRSAVESMELTGEELAHLGGADDAIGATGEAVAVDESTDKAQLAILCFGPIGAELKQYAIEHDFTLINMRFIKPLNERLVLALTYSHDLIVTVEEGARLGGIGEHVAAVAAASLAPVGCRRKFPARIINFGLDDAFIMEGSRSELLAEQGLDAASVVTRALTLRDQL